MFTQKVTNKDGVEKNVIAQTQEELDEQVKAIRGEAAPVAPNIDDPKDGNKVVSPDNTHKAWVDDVNRHKDVDNDPVVEPAAEPKLKKNQAKVKK